MSSPYSISSCPQDIALTLYLTASALSSGQQMTAPTASQERYLKLN